MKRISYTSYDYMQTNVVPVIASFDSEGHISPLYVRVQGEPFKIHSFWIKSSGRFNLIEYNCKLLKGNRIMHLNLIYHQAENIWTIPDELQYSS